MHARIAITSTMVMGILSTVALGASPGSRIVEYRIRDIPSDPESDVVLQAYLDIKPVASNGSEIAWQVSTVWMESVDSSGLVLATWWLDEPDVDSVDGLWRVTHSDTTNPMPSEFNELPELWGIAEPLDEEQGELAFSLYSTAPSGSGMYNGNEGLATYSLLTLSVPQSGVVVDEDGENEPVEIPDTEVPPN